MNYYIQGDAANADRIKAAFEKEGYDVTGFDMCNDNILFFTYELEGGGKVISTTNANLYTANIIKTHPDYKELELPVEPKFKVGDWIIKYDEFGAMIRRVDKLFSESYLLLDKFGVKYRISFYQQDRWRLWTITDAKDGDVLVNGGFIFIFKNIDDGNGVHFYCAYEIRSHEEYEQFHIACFNSLMGRVGNSYTHYTPATKEQRDLLFAKMKEAGYEWDAYKKELKKIIPHYDIANFKPFDKVLIRLDNKSEWTCDFFAYYHNGSFHCVGIDYWSQCIPFNEETKHLLGTTDMCDEQFINW